MSVTLKKGDAVSLSKDTVVSNISVGLGWSSSKYQDDDYDLDASCFILQKNGMTRYEDDFVFYNNVTCHNGSVRHSGDNLTGSSGNVDNEVITVDLKGLPAYATSIVFVVTIFEAERRMQNFGIIDSGFIRVVDNNTRQEILRYDLKEKFGDVSTVIAGEIYKDDSVWKFHAIGQGVKEGLEGLCEKYGIEVE